MPLYKNYLKKKQNPLEKNEENHLDVSPKTIINAKNQSESSKISTNVSMIKKPNLPPFDEEIKRIVDKYTKFAEKTSDTSSSLISSFDISSNDDFQVLGNKQTRCHGNAIDESQGIADSKDSSISQKKLNNRQETQNCQISSSVDEIIAEYLQSPKNLVIDEKTPQESSQKSLSMNDPKTKKAQNDYLDEDIREIVAKYSETINDDESLENPKCQNSQTSQKDSQNLSQKSQLSMNSPRTKKAYIAFMKTQKDSSDEDIREIVAKYSQTPDVSINEDESPENTKCRNSKKTSETSQKDCQNLSQLSMNSPRTKKAYIAFMETQEDFSDEDIREIVAKYSQTPDISINEDESPENTKCQNSEKTSQRPQKDSQNSSQLLMNSPRTKKAYVAFMKTQRDSSDEDIREIVAKYSQTPDVSINEDESPENTKCQNSEKTSQRPQKDSQNSSQLLMNSPRTKIAYIAFMKTQRDSSDEDIREIVAKYSQTPDISITEDESSENPQNSKKTSKIPQEDSQSSSQLLMNSPRTKKAYIAFMETQEDSSDEDIREIVARYSETPDVSITEDESPINPECDKNLPQPQNSKQSSQIPQKDSPSSLQIPETLMIENKSSKKTSQKNSKNSSQKTQLSETSMIEDERAKNPICDKNLRKAKKTPQKNSLQKTQPSRRSPRLIKALLKTQKHSSEEIVKDMVAKYSQRIGLSKTTVKSPKKPTHCTQKNHKNAKKPTQKTTKSQKKPPPKKETKQKKKPTQSSPNQTFEEDLRALVEKYSQSSNSQDSQKNTKQVMLSIIENLDVPEDKTLDETRTSICSQRSSIDTAIEELSLLSTQELTRKKSSDKRRKNLDKNNNKRRKTYNSQEEVDEFVNGVIKSRNVGLYVICDSCEKMRYLENCVDPLDLPEMWFCNMHPDQRYNDCGKPVEIIDTETESNLIENLYNAGSIVWAKIDGHPWWPAMVDDDPDYGVYYCLDDGSSKPTAYHVTLFGHRLNRAWIKPKQLIGFKKGLTKHKTVLKRFYRRQKQLNALIPQVKKACLMSLSERIRNFTFLVRYKKTHAERLAKRRQKIQDRKGLKL